MKLAGHREKVGKHGEIRIPNDYLKTLGINPGEEVEMRLTGKQISIEPLEETSKKQLSAKSPVDALIGLIPIGDPEFIDELLADEDIYG